MKFSHLSIRTKIFLSIIIVVLVVFIDTFISLFTRVNRQLLSRQRRIICNFLVTGF